MQSNVNTMKGLSFDSSLSNIDRIHSKKFNSIYIITNLINGKSYVGFHSTNDLYDSYFGSGRLINMAIKKYGKQNFKKEIIECCLLNEWKEKETFWIKEKNTQTPNGYNITSGGEGVIGIDPWNKGLINCYSEDTLKLWSNKRKGVACKNKESFCAKGRKFSKEHKDKLATKKSGSNNPMFGKSNWDIMNKTKKKCEYCGMETSPGNYTKWHGQRCKYKF